MQNEIATLRELCAGLNDILRKHPELGDRPVHVHSESGYSGAAILKDIGVYTNQTGDWVAVLTDDDHDVGDGTQYTLYR